jgi:hypothetical protein
MASTLRRASSLSNRRRTSARENFANTMRPNVAAIAATIDSKMKLFTGTARPMNDIVVQVGGAKAGKMLSTKTTMNSAMAIWNSVMTKISDFNDHHSLHMLANWGTFYGLACFERRHSSVVPYGSVTSADRQQG